MSVPARQPRRNSQALLWSLVLALLLALIRCETGDVDHSGHTMPAMPVAVEEKHVDHSAHDHSAHDHSGGSTMENPVGDGDDSSSSMAMGADTTANTLASNLKVYTTADLTGCYVDPTSPDCILFKQSNEDSLNDINVLCTAMPYMIGCSLHQACEDDSNNTSGACSPFSLLSDLCLDMPGMKGCVRYNALCGTPGSVVEQCTVEAPIGKVLLTVPTTNAILQMCSTHNMPKCYTCTSSQNCPDPMSTISQLCLGMPGMSQCSTFFSFCDEAGDTFYQFCSQQDPDALPPMKMYLHAAMRELILMKEWVPDSNGAYIGSCLAVIVAGIVVSYLKAMRVRLEVKWAAERAVTCAGGCGAGIASRGDNNDNTSLDYVEKGLAAKTTGGCPGCHPAASASSSVPQKGPDSEASSETNDIATTTTTTCRQHTAAAAAAPALLYHKATSNISTWVNSGQAKRNLFRSMFTGVVVFLDYMLMLIVMTFNIGLIVSAVLGFMLGAVLFGHYGERQPGSGGVAAGVAAGSMAPQDESDMEVHFVEQACCNTHHIGG